jgi:zinc transport system substrate-binding protein
MGKARLSYLRPVSGMLWVALLLLISGTALATPRVVVSIAPVHSLVAGVMNGVAEPHLLIGANASPHAYTLRPSDARALNRADLVVWVGEGLETVLAQPMASLGGNARALALLNAEGMWLLPVRQGGVWERHEHPGEDHSEGHDHGHHHDKADIDTHLWLAPRNARRIVELVVEELVLLDPVNAERYRANARAMTERINTLAQALRDELAPLQGRPYIVFHDAYHYFEDSFSLSPAGAISVSPEHSPGARRISEIRQVIQARGARCVFSEPQFRPAIVKVVTEGSGARAGELDPLGAALSPGKDLWFGLMQALGDNLRACLLHGEPNVADE